MRIFILMAFAMSTVALGNPADKSPLTLGEVNGESDNDSSTVNIRFNRKPDFNSVSVSSHGSFIQIDLPGTLVPNPGSFHEGNSPYIKKIMVYQPTSKEGAVRMFVSSSAAKIQNAMRAEILGNRILVTVDHSLLADRQVAAAPTAASPKSVSAASNEKAITPADVALGKATAEEAGFATGGIDFRDKIVKISAFIGGLMFFAVLAMMMKPLLRRRRNKKRRSADAGEIEERVPEMSTLATMPIGPKQKLSLIQVGDQKILIAIGPDSTTFMTTIGGPAPQAQPAPAAVAAPQPAGLPAGFGQPMSGLSQALAHAQMQQQIAAQSAASAVAHAQTPQRAPAATASPNFATAVAAASDQAQIKLKQRPAATATTEDTADVAEQPPARKRRAVKPKAKKQTKATGNRINVAVGDDGVKNIKSDTDTESADPKTIEDVTQLIRQKLQTFKAL